MSVRYKGQDLNVPKIIEMLQKAEDAKAEIERLKGEIEKLERHWAADHERLTKLREAAK